MKKYNKEEFFGIIKPILKNNEFQKRKEYQHHENESVYIHCLKVSKLAYKMSLKIKNIDIESVAIGALLHDFYTDPWQHNGKLTGKKTKNIFKAHGFTHAQDSYTNALDVFPNFMNKKIEDIILRHMFPLNIKPPKYIESWIVTTADKYISLSVFKTPNKIPKYLGININERKNKNE